MTHHSNHIWTEMHAEKKILRLMDKDATISFIMHLLTPTESAW